MTATYKNILKLFFQLGEKSKDYAEPRTIEQIQHKRPIDIRKLTSGLQTLKKQGYLLSAGNSWQVTEEGFKKGKRVLKLHRLWEVYLTQYLKIAPDHVHDDAERIEHIITPELEKQLEALLEYPDKDPHESDIPY